MLSRKEKLILNKWELKSGVVCQPDFKSIKIELANPDFPKEYLPFYDAALWNDLNTKIQTELLSWAWFIYNHKTIIIEQEIICAFCKIVITRSEFLEISFDYKLRLSQIQIDESYHTLMSLYGIKIIDDARKIGFKLDSKLAIQEYVDQAKSLSSIEYEIALFVASIISENAITAYLNIMSNRDDIQKICKVITEIHRKDEATHSTIFLDLFRNNITNINSDILFLIQKYYNKYISAFVSYEDSVWNEILSRYKIEMPSERNPLYKSIFNLDKINDSIKKLASIEN
jgi:alpha-N-dichloroacetyl-p-aminophenylserinol N-oxygenase